MWGGSGTSLPSCSDVVFCGNTPDAWNPDGIYDDGGNSIAEKCGDDCNGNDLVDEYEILLGFADDCDSNGVPDECDIANGFDCNGNGIPDACDIADGTSTDCDQNGLPDECDGDCNGNGVLTAATLLMELQQTATALAFRTNARTFSTAMGTKFLTSVMWPMELQRTAMGTVFPMSVML